MIDSFKEDRGAYQNMLYYSHVPNALDSLDFYIQLRCFDLVQLQRATDAEICTHCVLSIDMEQYGS